LLYPGRLGARPRGWAALGTPKESASAAQSPVAARGAAVSVCQRCLFHRRRPTSLQVCLAIDSPLLDEASSTAALLAHLNAVFTLCFAGELAIKVVSLGFVTNGAGSYLKQPWNVLDFCIVVNSLLVYLAALVPFFAQLKVLRILRVLRPLRLLQRDPGMKLIIMSLLKTMPSVVDVTAVVLVFHVVFAIIGMQLFSGEPGPAPGPGSGPGPSPDLQSLAPALASSPSPNP
jgi:hypothetical protein